MQVSWTISWLFLTIDVLCLTIHFAYLLLFVLPVWLITSSYCYAIANMSSSVSFHCLCMCFVSLFPFLWHSNHLLHLFFPCSHHVFVLILWSFETPTFLVSLKKITLCQSTKIHVADSSVTEFCEPRDQGIFYFPIVLCALPNGFFSSAWICLQSIASSLIFCSIAEYKFVYVYHEYHVLCSVSLGDSHVDLWFL